MNIRIFTWDKFYNDLIFKDKKLIGIFFDFYIFSFFLWWLFLHCHEKVYDDINSVVQIPNLAVIHKSQSVKLNSGLTCFRKV